MKPKKTILIAGLVALAIAVTSCGGSKRVSKREDFGVKITVPCSGTKFSTDSKMFRGTGSGISTDLSTANTKARLDANRNLAEGIQVRVKAVTDRYTNEREISDASEFHRKFEDLTRQVIDQELNNVRIACQETLLKDGKYTVFMAVEVAKDELLNSVNNRISKDDKLRQDYDKMKFEKIFNEEMEKLARE